MAAHLPSPRAQSNIQMGILLGGEAGKGFQMSLGRHWVWQEVQDKGGVSRSLLQSLLSQTGLVVNKGPFTHHAFDVTRQDDSSFLSCLRGAEFSYACGCWEVVGVGVGACLGRGGVCAPLSSLGYITALIRLYLGAAATA